MSSLRFAQFSGEIPRLISRLLPDGAGGLWRVDAGDLGQLTIKRGASQWYGEPVVRWPSNEDPWLVSLVGDGDPVIEDTTHNTETK